MKQNTYGATNNEELGIPLVVTSRGEIVTKETYLKLRAIVENNNPSDAATPEEKKPTDQNKTTSKFSGVSDFFKTVVSKAVVNISSQYKTVP